MFSNQIVSARVLSHSIRPSDLSHACCRWAKGALLSASLGAALLLGLGATPALAAPTNGTGGPTVFSPTLSMAPADNGTGGPTVFSATVTPDNGTGGPTVF